MLLGILIPLGVLGAILLGAVLFLARGPGGADLSPRGLLRLYLYLASLVSVLVLAFGLSLVGTGLLGAAAPEFTHGTPPTIRERPAPPPGAPPPGAVERPVPPSPEELNDRRTRESLLQGITMALAGALFWAVHWYGRRRVEVDADRASALRRAYFLVGTAVFGIAAIVLVPTALSGALRYFLIPVPSGEFRQGAGENLAAAAVVVPIWLAYLRIVLEQQSTPLAAAAVPSAEVP